MTKSASVLSLTDPYKSSHGGTIRTRALIDSLAAVGYDVSVLTPESYEQSNGTPHGAADRSSEPMRRKNSVENAGNEELRPYIRFGSLANDVRRLKHKYLPMPTEIGARSDLLRARVVEQSAELILVSVIAHTQYARLEDNLVWQDYMDLWGQFGAREARARQGLSRFTASFQASQISKREIRAAINADIVTVTGWKDWKFLSQYCDATWLPTPLPDAAFEELVLGGDADNTAGFIGNFEYWPNRDAYRMLVECWLPALRARGWRVLVAGRGSERLGDPPEGIELMGEVANVDEFFERINVSLAPIRLGGGMKVKVLESLAKGTPVIGTHEALEGFSPEVRDLCNVWGEHAHARDLDSVKRINPKSTDLDPYRMSSARDVVRQALRAVGGGQT